jgi:hypothetical protein
VPSPASLPAALLDHAARHPEEPWLFHREGWDWRWHSWGGVAGQVVREAERLASLAPGTRIAVPDVPLPESIVLDLAAQAAGLVSVPADGEPVELQSGLLAAVQRIQDEIPPSPKPGREILVAGRSLFDPADRAMLAWAVVAGAAVLLEPHPQARAATAAWARSTVFHGTVEEIAHLRRSAETGSGRRWWRLRVIFAAGDQPLPEGDAAFWRDRGVKVSRIAAERRNRGI